MIQQLEWWSPYLPRLKYLDNFWLPQSFVQTPAAPQKINLASFGDIFKCYMLIFMILMCQRAQKRDSGSHVSRKNIIYVYIYQKCPNYSPRADCSPHMWAEHVNMNGVQFTQLLLFYLNWVPTKIGLTNELAWRAGLCMCWQIWYRPLWPTLVRLPIRFFSTRVHRDITAPHARAGVCTRTELRSEVYNATEHGLEFNSSHWVNHKNTILSLKSSIQSFYLITNKWLGCSFIPLSLLVCHVRL